MSCRSGALEFAQLAGFKLSPARAIPARYSKKLSITFAVRSRNSNDRILCKTPCRPLSDIVDESRNIVWHLLICRIWGVEDVEQIMQKLVELVQAPKHITAQ